MDHRCCQYLWASERWDRKKYQSLDTAFKEFTARFNFPYSLDITLEGGGAAGGTAYGLKVFLNAQFINGFDFLASIACLEDLLVTQKYDYVISGKAA